MLPVPFGKPAMRIPIEACMLRHHLEHRFAHTPMNKNCLGDCVPYITGTVCGLPIPTRRVARYGMVFQSDIFVAIVTGSSGGGTIAQYLAGLNWAIGQKCEAILGAMGSGGPLNPAFTAAGNGALARGCLILTGAGHPSMRPSVIAPTGAPANSPSIVAVGALDTNLNVARFSPGGKIDIAAPGVNIFSCVPAPALYADLSGSSMAAAHVAGCAALWAEADSRFRGARLRDPLFASARHLPFPATDVGAGLVQAP